ncbi:MAG: hypothetical protein ABS935_08585 [Solibacillus sp.]|uniref:hypothetical protein n=1 Tax=Solibacillus sp. TaxID=1909654 RepID=UPI003315B0DF
MKKKFSIFLLLAGLVCGIFSYTNNSYAVTQERELKEDQDTTISNSLNSSKRASSTEFQPLTVTDSKGVSYLTTEEYLRTPSGLPIYKTELLYSDFYEVQKQEFIEFTKKVEGHLYKGTLKLYRAEKSNDGWKAMYSGIISTGEAFIK